MARWYIGKERADYLLRFAESELAKYAYSISPDLYRTVHNILKTQIPLWVEERRGPVDARGVPLFSLQGYLKFIKWWIAKMVSTKGGNDMTRIGASGWVHDVFDPARKVFGHRRLSAAIDVSGVPGAEELMNPEINIGPYYAKLLYLHGLDKLYTYTSSIMDYANSTGNEALKQQVNTLTQNMDQWLQNVTSSWQNELLTPTDPKHPSVKLGVESGSGVMKKLYDALDRIVYYNVRKAAFGVDPESGYESSYHPPKFTPPATLGYGFAGGPDVAKTYMPDPFAEKGAVPGYKTFKQLMQARGDNLDLIGDLIRTGISYSEATHRVNQAADAFSKEYRVLPGDELMPQDEAMYKSDLATLKATVMNQ